MKKEIAALWTAALRSGNYKQAGGALREEVIDEETFQSTGDFAFCCLGVLCNLHAEAHPEIAATQTDPERYLGHHGNLPTIVMEWAGMSDNEGTYGPEGHCLIDDNDTESKNFSQIADIIDENVDTL